MTFTIEDREDKTLLERMAASNKPDTTTEVKPEVFENSATGTRIEVFQKGKGFRTVETAPATANSEAYRKERNHRAYSGVEKLVDRRGATLVDLSKANEMIVEYSEAITEFGVGVHTIIHQPVDGVRKVSIENEPTNYTCRKIAGKWTVLFNSSPVATVTRAGDLIKAIAKHSGTEYPKG